MLWECRPVPLGYVIKCTAWTDGQQYGASFTITNTELTFGVTDPLPRAIQRLGYAMDQQLRDL